MASEVGICNRAIQRLGATRIVTLEDASKNARACNTAYVPVRDALLRKYAWAFAIKRASLAADVTGPDHGPTNYFTLPPTLMRLLPPNDPDLDWLVEDGKIATFWSAPLLIRYVDQVTDPNKMDPIFREVLALQLAHELAEEIAKMRNTGRQTIREDLRRIIAEAKRANSIEQISQLPPEDDWVTVRNDGRLPLNTRIGG